MISSGTSALSMAATKSCAIDDSGSGSSKDICEHEAGERGLVDGVGKRLPPCTRALVMSAAGSEADPGSD